MQDLSLFNFKIEYKAGKLNLVPDLLSRNPNHKPLQQEMVNLNTHTMLPVSTFAYISSHIEDSPLLTKILQEQKKVKIGELNQNKNSPFSTY